MNIIIMGPFPENIFILGVLKEGIQIKFCLGFQQIFSTSCCFLDGKNLKRGQLEYCNRKSAETSEFQGSEHEFYWTGYADYFSFKELE